MRHKKQLLPILCICAMVILLGLQGYWIVKYYAITKKAFEKEVNMVFEDAFKKEFSKRADLIQAIIKDRLLDTTHFLISSQLQKDGTVQYRISETKNPKDQFTNSFSSSDLNIMITPANRKAVVHKVAENFAELFRNEDLDNHIIYYRTQNLGKFMSQLTEKYQFDTLNLRPILDSYLANRSISVRYKFYTAKKDSTTNQSTFSTSLTRNYPIITRSLPTYTHAPGQNYVRVMFENPVSYVLSNLWLVLLCSVFLVLLIAFCLAYLLKVLGQEKRLSLIKNDFISNITHEFKTPIATAMLAVEALSDRQVRTDQEKTERYLKHAKNELNRISELTDMVLKISLYEQGGYALNKEMINIDQIIEEIIELNQLSVERSKITFANPTGLTEIAADRTQFQHAISNIIDNAIKYGSAYPQIEISCSLNSGHFVIKISDDGTGIDQSELPLVFEKFYRAKQQTDKVVKGYGLGLNYVKQIMELHSGWYTLSSSPNGTVLKLGWPI